jgi:hypothetical protein
MQPTLSGSWPASSIEDFLASEAEFIGQMCVSKLHLSADQHFRGLRQGICRKVRRKVARATGLEPATSGVTGRHSNQLSYARAWIGGSHRSGQ